MGSKFDKGWAVTVRALAKSATRAEDFMIVGVGEGCGTKICAKEYMWMRNSNDKLERLCEEEEELCQW